MPTTAHVPLILVRGFGGLDVEDERRIAYQGFNDGTVYPQKRGENYIYERLILNYLKSDWRYHDATNVVGYYSRPVEDRRDLPPELQAMPLNKVVTLGTPHRGISFQGIRDFRLVDADEELERFNPKAQPDPSVPWPYPNLARHFPPARLPTVVGTNYRTYGSRPAAALNRLFSAPQEHGWNCNRSDGLVKQSSAQLPGSPRTFIHTSTTRSSPPVKRSRWRHASSTATCTPACTCWTHASRGASTASAAARSSSASRSSRGGSISSCSTRAPRRRTATGRSGRRRSATT